MTEDDAVEKARRLARERGIVLDPADIHESIPYALEDTGRWAADGMEYQLQQKDYTVAIASGIASLTSHSDMLIDTIETVKHPSIDGANTVQFFYRIPNGTEHDLAVWTDPMNPPFIVEGTNLKLSLGNGTFPAADDLPPNANLTVRANFIPTISTIHSRFEDRLIHAIVEQAQQRAKVV